MYQSAGIDYAKVIWAAESFFSWSRWVKWDERVHDEGAVDKIFSRTGPRQEAMPRAKPNIHYHSMSGSFLKRNNRTS
ncbi:hypothetical protein N7466_001514 [Penicillium verhagenii]|uniref:uncharacterized protein n=1 Tax=Penicillium verhagenii TaxID=1562060 RepID=UPI002544F200|nr:uncharacterized protein N7466_001514 [Penicillium verhagenii]KAJ5938380.1 hypothetical protein N7466_001514 [Penicillium verhagenii]